MPHLKHRHQLPQLNFVMRKLIQNLCPLTKGCPLLIIKKIYLPCLVKLPKLYPIQLLPTFSHKIIPRICSKRQTKKYVITIKFHLHPNMYRLSINAPKHKEFLDSSQFTLNVTINYQKIIQTPCEQFIEATQNKAAEDMREPHTLFQFLGRVNSPSHVRNFRTFVNFEKSPTFIKKPSTPNKIHGVINAPRTFPSIQGTCTHNAEFL